MEWEAVSVGLLSVLPPIVAIVLALITKAVSYTHLECMVVTFVTK